MTSKKTIGRPKIGIIKKPITCYLEAREIKKLKEIARIENRTLANLVFSLIIDRINKEQEEEV